MEQIEFKKLLFKVAFCTMACDGEIDKSEMDEMEYIDKNTSYFNSIDLSEELSHLISDFNKKGTKVIEELFQVLKDNDLNIIQELLVLEVAMRIINADGRHDENEVKFIHLLRAKLVLHDETIIDRFGVVDLLHVNEYTNIMSITDENTFISDMLVPDLSILKDINIQNKE